MLNNQGGEQMSMSKTIWVTEFTTESVQKFFQEFTDLHDSEVPIITVYIDSYGGELYSLNAMRDILKSSLKPVCTVAVGKAMSCGSFLLAAGTPGYRFASTNSTIMVHHALWGQIGNMDDQIHSIEYNQRIVEGVYDNFTSDTKISKVKFKQKLKSIENRDWYLSPSEALKEGLVDYIGFPNLLIGKLITGELSLGNINIELERMKKNATPKKSNKRPKARR